MKYYVAMLLFLPALSVSSDYGKHVIISMPASGSHQLIKCVSLLYHGKYPTPEEWQYRFRITHHLSYSEERMEEFAQKRYKILLNVRDPRDRLISYARVYQNTKDKRASIGNIALKLIRETDGFYFPLTRKYVPLAGRHMNLLDQYNYYIPWLNYPDILVIKFENLIGPKGGGSLSLQQEEIKKIAAFLDIPLSEEKLAFVTSNLWGGTMSFRNPQVGQWKKYFTDKHNQALSDIGMKKVGEILGYPL